MSNFRVSTTSPTSHRFPIRIADGADTGSSVVAGSTPLRLTEIMSRTVRYGLAVADLFARDTTNKAAFSENAGSLCPAIISYALPCTRP